MVFKILSLLMVILIGRPTTSKSIEKSSLTPAQPLFWSKTDQDLSYGDYVDLILIIKFETECSLFKHIALPENQKEFIDWCTKEVNAKIIQPLEELCDVTISHHRPKREPITIIASIFGIISASIAIYNFVAGVGSTRVPTYENEFKEISSSLLLLRDKNTELKQKQDELEARLDEITSRLDTVKENVQLLTDWKNNFTKSLAPTVILTSKLATSFENANSMFKEVLRDWKARKPVNFKLFDIMLPNVPQKDLLIYNGTVPVKCSVRASRGIVTFVFRKESKDQHVAVLNVNPFTFYQFDDSNPEYGYKLEYVGPKYAVYDSLSDCTVPLSSTNNLVSIPSKEDCAVLHEKSVEKYWKKTCERFQYFDHHEVVQVKVVEQNYVIYCYGLEVELYKKKQKCPPYPFQVSKEESVTILSGSKEKKRLSPSGLLPSTYSLSAKVNHHLMPGIGELDIETFGSRNPCNNGQLTWDNPTIIIGLAALGGVIVLTAGLCLTVYILCSKKCSSTGAGSQNDKIQVSASDIKQAKEVELKPMNGSTSGFVDPKSFLQAKDVELKPMNGSTSGFVDPKSFLELTKLSNISNLHTSALPALLSSAPLNSNYTAQLKDQLKFPLSSSLTAQLKDQLKFPLSSAHLNNSAQHFNSSSAQNYSSAQSFSSTQNYSSAQNNNK